jgi:putative transposase
VLVFHWRTYRHTGHWLSQGGAEKWNDRLNADQPRLLHAHSVDAAQQGFSKACKTARECRKAGLDTRYPYKRKRFRTTIWKQSGIRWMGDHLLLSRARRLPPIRIMLPDHLRDVLDIREVRLVYDRVKHRYFWHLVVENGKQPKAAPGTNVVSVDLGEVHPAVVGDDQESTIITCRARRHEVQGFQKRLAKFNTAMARKKKGSRQWHRLRKAKIRLRAKHQRVMRDMEHKISRAVVNVVVERQAGTIALGDVRDVADKGTLGKKTNQKVSGWSHGKVREYLTYKAEAEGIQVELVNEAYTSQTCPHCGARHKPRGRVYRCPSCGFQAHRDVVGQVNILSRYRYGAPGKLPAPREVKHRIPVNRVMRRCHDIGLPKRGVACGPPQEAAGL